MKNLAIASVAGLALAASANAQVVDLSGQIYDGAAPMVAGSTNVGGVTDIQFDVSVTTFSPSWGEEVIIDIAGPGGFAFRAAGGPDTLNGPTNADLTFGWGASTGTFTFSGTASGLSGGAGTYTVSVFDEFDDFGDDGVFNSGSTVTLIPAPGAAALLGIGGLAATRRRR